MKKIIIGGTIIGFIIFGLGIYLIFEKNNVNLKIKKDFVDQLSIDEIPKKEEKDSGIVVNYKPKNIYIIYNMLFNNIDVEVKEINDKTIVLDLKTVNLEKINKNLNEKEVIEYLSRDTLEKKSHTVSFEYDYKDGKYIFKYNNEFFKAVYYSFFDDYINNMEGN